ncbi:formylglycine-generating enzyme family protein [Mastigocladopsis repens]|uniref:formylglycine-generating enzyme family protein n=1 Tax=Mastigocladopsis repens TaxID=221287 RepID=UPI0003096777|nr:formylglycine-generating enzyme family protein [Mastigocladopsis repens]
MTPLTHSNSTEKFSHPRLNAFAKRFGEVHVDFACHAAFPLALTPELLYCLRENFLPHAPWIAVADILLFLCDPVGYQLYELEGEVRNELLVKLKNRFDEKRLDELSDFMVAYIRQQLKTNERADQDLGAAPQWTALAYIKPKEAVHDIAQTLQRALAHKNPAEWVQLTSLIESYADVNPLIESGFQPLLRLARGWDAKARGESEAAAAEFNQLGQPGKQIQIGKVKFKIPPADNDDKLLTFEFEVVTVNRRGEIIKRETRQAQYFTQDLGKDITLEMVAIPGGKFMMGSPEPEGHESEKPQHQVTVQPFFISKYPITQAQWRAVSKLPKVKRQLKREPSHFKGDDRPVECVTWYEAVEFCARLSRKTGREYRLPSEAEWEYACRAGTTTPFHFGETITDKLANYDASSTFADEPKGESRKETTPVGAFLPNAFGLYDMHGNVWEWCADTWHDNYEGAPTNGSAWIKQKQNDNDNRLQLLRGGSWYNYPDYCRSAYRNRVIADYYDNNLSYGFRVVCGFAARTLP